LHHQSGHLTRLNGLVDFQIQRNLLKRSCLNMGTLFSSYFESEVS